MGKRARPQWLRILVVLATVAVVAAAVVTDLHAHARTRSEHNALESARTTLADTMSALATKMQTQRVDSTHQQTLQDSVSVALQFLEAAQQSLNQSNVSTYLEGLDIGQLQTCLTGVQQAYGQIAAHDNDQAASDLSGVSAACLSVAGSNSDGLVYPFDFPDPFVLRVGGDYFAYGTNSVGGNIQIIESTDLLHWNALGNALGQPAQMGGCGRHVGPCSRAVGEHLRAVLLGGRGRVGWWRNVHFCRHLDAAPGSLH